MKINTSEFVLQISQLYFFIHKVVEKFKFNRQYPSLKLVRIKVTSQVRVSGTWQYNLQNSYFFCIKYKFIVLLQKR